MCSTEDKMTTLERMRQEREISTVAFLSFATNCRKFNDHIFCFYEGEDGKYYNQKIQSILGANIIPIICGNKKETLKTWRRIKGDPYYHDITKMFFVDRDMDDIPGDKNDDLYICPCYSIENLYVNRETFKRILQSEFLVNKVEKDFEKCISLFDKLFEEFINEIMEFNACVLIRKQKALGNGKVPLKDFKVGQAFCVELNGISKSPKYKEQINKLKAALAVDEAEIQVAIQELKNIGDFSSIFRGKNQLDFMVLFLNLLKKANSNSEFFDTKRNCINFCITKNRLSELSQYALFPLCLKCFLEAHKLAS